MFVSSQLTYCPVQLEGMDSDMDAHCGLLLARLMGQYCFARWRLSGSVTLHSGPARRLHARRPGDDVMPPAV